MSKTAVAHKSALGSTNTWHTSIPQAGFVSKGEHGIITQKAHFSHSKADTATDTCHCSLYGWHPLGSAYLRSAYCCLEAKIQLSLLGQSRFHGGGRQSSRWTNIHPTTHGSRFLLQLEDALQTKGQQTEQGIPNKACSEATVTARSTLGRGRDSSLENPHIPTPFTRSWRCCPHGDVQSSALC